MVNHGIPTEYRFIRFRSRLEATWARFFDTVGWRWKYEPFDYDGYIPDFVLLFPHGEVLGEIKPALSLEELQAHTEKIDRSPWAKEALILGVGEVETSHETGWDSILGLLGCYDYNPQERVWEPGRFFHCKVCGQYSLHAIYGSFHCRANGCYDGNGHLGMKDSLEKQWALAQNLVQWAPRLFGSER